MNNQQEIKARLKKLKKLAERGIGGEKEAAAQLLKKLCEQHKISEEDLATEQLFELEMGVEKSFEFTLASVILLRTFGEDFDIRLERKPKNKMIARFETSIEIYSDIVGIFKTLYNHYLEEEKHFQRAFVFNHGLAKVKEIQPGEISEEELRKIREDMRRRDEFSGAITTKDYRRGIL